MRCNLDRLAKPLKGDENYAKPKKNSVPGSLTCYLFQLAPIGRLNSNYGKNGNCILTSHSATPSVA